MFPLGSSYFVFVFLSLWCLWWEMWDKCIDSWSLPSFLFFNQTESPVFMIFSWFCVVLLFPKAILFDFYWHCIWIVWDLIFYVNHLLITKTGLYNVDPLKPHFYIVKLGFIGVYIIFLISTKNIDCGYSLEPPRRGGSNGYSQSMFRAEIWKIEFFLSEIFQFLKVIFLLFE